PTIRAQRELAEDLLGASGVARRSTGPASEYRSARRRIAGPRRRVRSRDEDARDDRQAIRVVTDRQGRDPLIPALLVEREALRDERDADAMQPGFDRQAHRQALAHLRHRATDVSIRQRIVVRAPELGGMDDDAVDQDLKLERRLEPFHSADRAARR